MQKEIKKKVQKFKKTINVLCVKNVVLKVKVVSLQTTVYIKKAKKNRNKAIINQIS